eukprot:15183069-Ditylum_brightwellii.AAC.1
MSQQQKQRDEERANREQQMLLDRIERKANDRAHKEWELQREHCHQDFMMMVMMMMVTGNKAPQSSASMLNSPYLVSSVPSSSSH